MNLVNILKQKFDDNLRQALHNPVCWSCGLQHSGASLICDACRPQIKTVFNPCKLCGLSHQNQSQICNYCQKHPTLWQQMIAPLSFTTPVRELILQLKFSQKLSLLSALIELALPYYTAHQHGCLMPVPLHSERYRERGFNQSFEIAIMLAQQLDMTLVDQMISRVVNTPRQSELKFKQRQHNIKNAFSVDAKIKQFEHVIIVDDVITSGSTVKEVAKACLKQGVKRVDVWALARTEPPSR